ncbi:unnamed protein product [Oikopleura dioica]|uniref:Uncharacterized protein n=1 Tax=Oikopleura dioica TaxID=34765 RepID=E4WPZ3_OIKDI|nr:unnamed protein product [Oikopleura dioica]CBY33130.1 unnamed protein product [Oikopleura dioica]
MVSENLKISLKEIKFRRYFIVGIIFGILAFISMVSLMFFLDKEAFIVFPLCVGFVASCTVTTIHSLKAYIFFIEKFPKKSRSVITTSFCNVEF